ncbi:CHAT domain-containing protein [Flavisolibacter sp. BT320]|nr:CHAT domain-containing protein [Flavisolibacter longurius]
MAKKLIVNGSLHPANDTQALFTTDFEEFQNFTLAKSVMVSNSRSLSARHELEITDNGDIVEIRFEDETTWIGNAQEFHEIFNIPLNRGLDEDVLEVPGVLQASTERGVLQDLAINMISLFKPKKNIVGAAVQQIARRLEEKVQPQPGLYLLDALFRKRTADVFPDLAKPFLLLIHGTNSNATGAFGGLLDKPDHGLWKTITDAYGENILAFEHKTLTESPLQNTRQLLELLPSNSTLHLITHSRGGLVGDLLARASAGNSTIGFSETELALMQDRTTDLETMEAINGLARTKNIRVEKFIRVASPSMGTSLLADRLDHYLNTLLNLVGVGTGASANPVYMGVKALLSQVASSRADVTVLPGLEAMSPESPFIKMLNNPANVIEAPLTVIAGNCKLHLELKALLVILTKLYFRRKNDLVVDTWSMYFGTPRSKAVQFYLDDEQGTDHVKYFKSKASQSAIARALQSTTEAIPGFEPLEAADIAEANRNAALPFVVSEVKMNREVSGKKPIAIIMPGIMGSNLYRDDDRIWVDFWRFVKGDLLQLAINTPNITAPSLMGSGYRKLARHLTEAGYDVIAYAYDWRKDLSETAKDLDALVETLLPNGQPIHVLAHSMGGVLFREFMILNRQWPALNASPGFRALFLGCPLGGSYLIPETLVGRGGNITKLSILDLKHGKKELLEVFGACPGLYNLLPLTTTPHDFGNAETWRSLVKQANGLGAEPSETILKNFRRFRDRINSSLGRDDFRNIIYVAGHSDVTTATYAIESGGRGGNLVFKSTAEGDGSVTWASGILPVFTENKAVYYSTTIHGELANDETLFPAFRDLLKTGQTARLRQVPPPLGQRGTRLVDKPRYEVVPVTPRNIESVVLGIPAFREEKEELAPVRISMSNGDLRDARYPLVVGHFYRDGILGAEGVLDMNFGGVLREKHALNLYPGREGTNEVLLSYQTCPKGAIVVGLGEPGELNGYKLEQSIAQGISRYLLELREFEQINPQAFADLFRKGIGLSTVIVGAGYGGLSIENSIKSIILGVQKANEGVLRLNNPLVKTISHIEFVELYEDRALQAFYTVKKLEADSRLNIVLSRNGIKKLFGIRKRVPLDEQQDWWQRISVSIVERKPHHILKFSASTGAAREELRNLNSNPKLIQHFIDQASKKNEWSPQLAKTIFELLIPNDFKDAVRSQNHTVWKLDTHSAAFPWELLQDMATQAKPLCVSAGMIRQLATSEYRTQVNRSYKNNALVIGDPNLYDYASQLPGAVMEAEAVAALVKEQGYSVEERINEDFPAIVQALFQDEYKIIHLAGHGDFDPENPEQAGMLIGNGMFLSTKEIDQMSQVPEFVFVNCCHLGHVDEESERKSQQYYKLAANIGVQLIQMGVKAVIAAGWAVHDGAALLFAQTFYNQMFAGVPFGEAVREARSRCYSDFPDTNTWGAYQCYGDQFYSFRSYAPAGRSQKNYVLPMEIEVDLANLANKVESGRYEKGSILRELTDMEKAIDRSGLRDGSLTEREAQIYTALNEKEKAIEKLLRLRQYEEANFSVDSLERLCILRNKQLRTADAVTEDQLQAVIDDFEMLKVVGPTSRRYALLGSAYKTLSQKSTVKTKRVKALQQAAGSYHEAFLIAKNNNGNILYPLCNWLQIESLLMLIKDSTTFQWGGASLDNYSLPKLKQAYTWMDTVLRIGDGEERNLEFWHLLNEAHVLLTKLCMEPGGNIKKEAVSEAIETAWSRGGAEVKKQSELDHLRFLLDSLELSAKPKAKTLATSLRYVHEQLNKLKE